MDNMTPVSDEQLTEQLKSKKATGIVGALLKFGGIALALIGFFTTMIPLAVLGIIVCIVGVAIENNSKKAIKQLLGDSLVRSALESVFENVQYEPMNHISSAAVRESHMMLPEEFERVEGSDYVKAVYKGLNIELSDISLIHETEYYNEETNTWEKSETKVFGGQWLICDFGKELSAEVRLAEKTGLKLFKGSGVITTDNAEFDKRFKIRCDSAQDALYILTPHMMEYIISTADKSGGNVYMTFLKGGRLHIAVRTKRDFFELGKGQVDTAALRNKFANEIKWFTDIIDELRLVDTLYK